MKEQEFAAKVSWEGGILEALDYGLTAEDLPPGALRDAWRDLETAWQLELAPRVYRVEELLEAAE